MLSHGKEILPDGFPCLCSSNSCNNYQERCRVQKSWQCHHFVVRQMCEQKLSYSSRVSSHEEGNLPQYWGIITLDFSIDVWWNVQVPPYLLQVCIFPFFSSSTKSVVLFEASCSLLQYIRAFTISVSVIIIRVIITISSLPSHPLNPERLELRPALGGIERTIIIYNVKHKPKMYLVAWNTDKLRCTGGIWLVRSCLCTAARRINQFIWSIDFLLLWILILWFFWLESYAAKTWNWCLGPSPWG